MFAAEGGGGFEDGAFLVSTTAPRPTCDIRLNTASNLTQSSNLPAFCKELLRSAAMTQTLLHQVAGEVSRPEERRWTLQGGQKR